jgi:hypothetical protein
LFPANSGHFTIDSTSAGAFRKEPCRLEIEKASGCPT